jgi:hypothetical protein
VRDRIQLELNVSEYHDAMRAERRRNLAAALAMLERARRNGDEWYVWVLEQRDRRNGELVFEHVDDELVLL